MVVTYPRQSLSDGYPIALLNLAISRSGSNDSFILNEASVTVLQGRTLRLLKNKVEINVAWSMTSKDRERDLLPIKIPIYKGMYGYRLLFIKQGEQHRYDRNVTLQELKENFASVQGNDWPDIHVLKHNGFSVIGATVVESMFSMVEKGRVDYFPRSMLEIWYERQRHPHFKIEIEQNWVLHYPAYMYFFVHPEDTQLANVIETGLKAAIEDGSFDILFDSVQGDAVRKTQLSKRKTIELSNPNVDSNGVYQWPTIN